MTDIDGIKARSIGDANPTIFSAAEMRLVLDQLDAAQGALRLADAAVRVAATFDADPLGDEQQVDHYYWRRDHALAIRAARARQDEP